MGLLLKPIGETVTDPGSPSYPSYPATLFWLFAPPTPEDTQYRQKWLGPIPGLGPYFPDSPDDFNKWSQLDGSGGDGWRGPINLMSFIRFEGYPRSPNGYPLGSGDDGNFTGYFDVPTLTGLRRETRIYRKDGPRGCLTPYAHPFTDPPFCATGGPCGVTMLANFPGRGSVPAVPPTIVTDFRLGWNAGANSVLVLTGNVVGTFKPVPQYTLACGLSRLRNESNVADYTKIEVGVYCTNDGAGNLKFAPIENGLLVGPFVPYTEDDVFEIRRKDNVIVMKVAGTDFYTSLSLSAGPIRLATSMYGGGDEVREATFQQLDPEPPPPVGYGSLQAPMRLRAQLFQDAIPPNGGRLTMILPELHYLSTRGIDPPEVGYGAMALRLNLRAVFEDYGPTGLSVPLPLLRLQLYEATDRLAIVLPPIGVELTEAPPEPNPGEYDVELVRDAYELGSIAEAAVTAVIHERVRARAAQASATMAYRRLAERIGFEERIVLVYRALVIEGIALAGDVANDFQAVARVMDGLRLSGAVSSLSEARAAVIAGIAFGTLADMYAREKVIEAAGFDAQVAETLTAIAQIVDGILAAGLATGAGLLAIQVADGVALAAAPTSTADAFELIRDGAAFVLHLGLDSGRYTATVINAENKGVSTYQNYPFNSFAPLGGGYYGMTDDGIRRLGGPDDDGEPIKGRVRGAFSRMGSSRMKRLSTGYLGYTATGDLWLKVIVQNDVDQSREAHAYRLKSQPTGAGRMGRIPVGQGLRTTYVGYEIEAVDGAAFEIDVLEWLPILLDKIMAGEGGGIR